MYEIYKNLNKYNTTQLEQKMLDDTDYYSEKYHLDKDENYNDGWNDKKDAFRHTYASAFTRYFYFNGFSNIGTSYVELRGNIKHNQDKNEENMDKWNNQVGQEIGKEISNRLRGMRDMFKDEQIEDYIISIIF